MKQYTRTQLIDRLKTKLATGKIIVAGGAGTGISAKFEEEGGADILMVFNSGRYRMHGLGSLSGWMAYGDANAIALEMGERQVLPITKEVPVVCSVNGTDPTRVMSVFFEESY
jgi:predicted TIM-barrel enzyme